VASPEFAVLDLELDAFRRRVSAYAKVRDELRKRDESTEAPGVVVLSSQLLYLTPAQRAELTSKVLGLVKEYELEDPEQVPGGAERTAAMWSLIPDDRK
jgi:hypothetical protein